MIPIVLSILNLMKGQIDNFQLPQIDSQLILIKFQNYIIQ